jgi:hypothetical protein
VNNSIAKVGSSPVGLVRYLFGPGRENEHVDQRLIAADEILAVPDGTRLDHVRDRREILALGRELDAPRRLREVEAPGGHVWHCAISLPPDERLSDVQWAHVAHTAVEEMGFTAAPGRSPCRWLAVHHGPSTGGNDHIHLVVGLVRADGRLASIWRDRITMSRVCARLERELGLYVVPGRAGRGMPGYSRARASGPAANTGSNRTGSRWRGSCADPRPPRRARLSSYATFAAKVLARPRYAAGGGAVTGSRSVPPARRHRSGSAAAAWPPTCRYRAFEHIGPRSDPTSTRPPCTPRL